MKLVESVVETRQRSWGEEGVNELMADALSRSEGTLMEKWEMKRNERTERSATSKATRDVGDEINLWSEGSRYGAQTRKLARFLNVPSSPRRLKQSPFQLLMLLTSSSNVCNRAHTG